MSATNNCDSSPSKESVVSSTEGESIDESRTLFIGDLRPSSPNSAQMVREIFPDGKVLHIDVKVIESSKGPLCYAFITFTNSEAAQSALMKFDKGMVTLSDSSICRIGWARRNSRLHVSNLDESISEGALAAIFSPYGDINPEDGILIMRKPATCSANPQVVTYGVIHFEQRDCAETAKNALNGTFYDGRKLRVEWNRASRKSNMTRMAVVENERGTELVEIKSDSSTSPHRSSPGSTPTKPRRAGATATAIAAGNIISQQRSSVPVPTLMSLGGAGVAVPQQPLSTTSNGSVSSRNSLSQNGGGNGGAEASVSSSGVTNGTSSVGSSSHPASHFPMSIMAPVISIYVQFETTDAETKVNEALITEVFQQFGHMTGCFIKTNNTSVSGLRQHGYAFVHFENTPEGKKSALAAAALSKEAPFQHLGVLFHAEVSKNFRRATSVYGGGKFHTLNHRNFYNNNQQQHGPGPKHAPYPNNHTPDPYAAGAPNPNPGFEDPTYGHYIDSDGLMYPYPGSYPAYYYPNGGYSAPPYGAAYGGPNYNPYNAYGPYPGNGGGAPVAPVPVAPGGARGQQERSMATEAAGFPMLYPIHAYEQHSAAASRKYGDMASAQYASEAAAAAAAAASNAAGANAAGMAMMNPYMYPQAYYGMPSVPYGSVSPMMYPGTPYPPPSSPYNQNGLTSTMPPSYIQPSVYSPAGDALTAVPTTATVGADGSIIYSAAVPGQQGGYSYTYGSSSPMMLPSNGNGGQQSYTPSGSQSGASTPLPLPSVASGLTTTSSATSGGGKSGASLSVAPRQIADPTASPSVSQSQGYPPQQGRQSSNYANPHNSYSFAVAAASVGGNNQSGSSSSNGGTNTAAGPSGPGTGSGIQQGYDPSSSTVPGGYYATAMHQMNYGQWPQK